jgi:hypothetical protein
MILTTYPMTPMTTKPIPTAREIWRNSLLSAIQLSVELVLHVPSPCPQRTLCATVDELSSVPQELLGDFSHLLELVGHDERVVGGVFGV